MNYYIYAPIDGIIEKKIKNFKFNYARENINKSIQIIILKETHSYANVKKLVEHIENSIKKINSIKIETGDIDYDEESLICNIKLDNKLKKLIQLLHSNGKYFQNSNKPPYIPIINNRNNGIDEEDLSKLNKELRNKKFFIRQIGLYVNHHDYKEPEKIRDFTL